MRGTSFLCELVSNKTGSIKNCPKVTMAVVTSVEALRWHSDSKRDSTIPLYQGFDPQAANFLLEKKKCRKRPIAGVLCTWCSRPYFIDCRQTEGDMFSITPATFTLPVTFFWYPFYAELIGGEVNFIFFFIIPPDVVLNPRPASSLGRQSRAQAVFY